MAVFTKAVESGSNIDTAIKEASKAMDAVIASMCGGALEMTPREVKVLVMLLELERGAAPTQKQLADEMGMDGSTLVPVFDSLEKRGYITRTPDPKDRRNNIITLARSAKSGFSDTLVESVGEANHVLFEGISKADIARMLNVLAKIKYNAQKHMEQNEG